ncbi:MAG: hypothetical protein COA44_04345 [Arcobacter sp.]|nr:MAG: hypothetical protein COA44_04345 [Arcobacter sp.]
MFNSLKMTFINIINSGWDFNEDQKLEQLRFQIVNFSLILSLCIVPIGMIYNYFTHNFVLIYIETSVSIFLLFIILRLRKNRVSYEINTSILTLGILLFFDALFLFSKPEDMKFTWILVYISVFIFYKGNKEGWKWILAFCLTLILVKLQSFHPIFFTWTQISYFFLVLFALVGTISFFQYTIEQNYQTILEQKNILKAFNKELEDKISKEVTRTRQKDKILFQQSKMADMGKMLANIAHQWRQPLNTISVVAGGMQVHKDIGTLDDKRFEENINTIENTVQFLSQTIDDFKDYFRSDKHKEDFDIQASIAQDIRLIEPSFRALGINIISNLQSYTIHSYQSQLAQVILNILNNAKDALVHCKQKYKYIFISSKEKDNKIIITITDNAGGIPQEIINNIFDPYFTTKHKSQGTGIGLFMAEEIISKHLNGSIQVLNIEYEYEEHTYKGAQFDIFLNKDTISHE